MEGLFYIILLGICLFGTVFFSSKAQDRKDAKKLIETVEWQRLNNYDKSSRHITRLCFNYLLSYMCTSRKGKVEILKSELRKSSLASEETKVIISRSINIFFYLQSKLGTPLDNFCERDFYKEKVKAYQSFNDMGFWVSLQEKEEYIEIWGKLCEKGSVFRS